MPRSARARRDFGQKCLNVGKVVLVFQGLDAIGFRKARSPQIRREVGLVPGHTGEHGRAAGRAARCNLA